MNFRAIVPPEAEILGVKRIGNQTILHGDCLAKLQTLDNETIDVVVTSPPYNIGVNYRSYDDKKPREVYLRWLSDIGNQLRRVLVEDGSLFINVGGTGSDPWIVMDVANAFRKVFELQNHIVWVKSLSIGDESFGHFKRLCCANRLMGGVPLAPDRPILRAA